MKHRGGWGAPLAIPSNVTLPFITGNDLVGSTLTVDVGAWTPTPLSYTYQWQRNGSNIVGQTSSTYVSTGTDVGTALTCEVSATNASGTSAPQDSISFSTVKNVPANTSLPTIVGSGLTQQLLTATTGTWTGDVISYSYQWTADNVDISGATAVGFEPGDEYIGFDIRVKVTATNSVGSTTATSASIEILDPPTIAMSFVGVGSATTSTNVPIPVGVQAEDLILLCVVSKLSTRVPTASGYTLLASVVGGDGPDGELSGQTLTSVLYKIAAGTEGGTNISVSFAGSNTGDIQTSRVAVYRRDYRLLWDIVAATGADDDGGEALFLATATSSIALQPTDYFLAVAGHNASGSTSIAGTNGVNGLANGIKATGFTFGTNTKQIDNGSTNGNDCRLVMVDALVSTGTGNATPTIQLGGTATTYGLSGGAIFIRLRQVETVADDNFDDIAFLAMGDVSAGTTSVVVDYPDMTGVAVGSLLVMNISTKFGECRPVTPAGWRRPKDTMSSHDGRGGDIGQMKMNTFYKFSTASEPSSITVQVAPAENSNSVLARMMVFSRDLTANCWVDVVDGGHNYTTESSASTTAWSAKSNNPIESVENDFYLVCSAINTDNYNMSGKTLVQSGATFTSIVNIFESGITTGNDQKQTATLFKVTSPTAVSGQITFNMTSSSSGIKNPTGQTHFIRIRQTTATQDYIPSCALVMDPGLQTSSTLNPKGGVWGYGKADYQGTLDTSSDSDYDLVTWNSKPHFRMRRRPSLGRSVAQGGNATLAERRIEYYLAWQPYTQLGTKRYLVYEVSLSGMGAPPSPYIIFQNHPGRLSSYPSSWSNHPLQAIEICGPNQYIQNKGPGSNSAMAPAGSIIFCHNTRADGVNNYWMATHNGVPYEDGGTAITFSGTKTLRFEIMIKSGLAGAGKIIYRVTDLTNSLTYTYTNSTHATVTQEADPALGGLGVVPLVGGAYKQGMYIHSITDASNGDPARVAAAQQDCKEFTDSGCGTMTLYYRYWAYAEKQPSDWDYADANDEATFTYLRNYVA